LCEQFDIPLTNVIPLKFGASLSGDLMTMRTMIRRFNNA